jgi:hypothetical protein
LVTATVTNAVTCRGTATAVVRLIVSQVEQTLHIQVLREYRYPKANARGKMAKHSVHHLRRHNVLLPLDTPSHWGDVWYTIFDMASAMISTHPRQSVWSIFVMQSVSDYARGVSEMLARSIAMELGFEFIDCGMEEVENRR